MKRNLINAGTITLMTLMSHSVSFAAGNLFNVTPIGNVLNITTTIAHQYPRAGIHLNTSGYSLLGQGTECQPQTNGYCLFSVSNTQAANISISNSGATTTALSVSLCLNGKGPLSCQNYNNLIININPTHAYVTNSNGSVISVCTLNSSTGLITTCQNAGGGSALSGTEPQGIVLNNAGTMAYISSFALADVIQCPINANASFGTCIATPITSPSGFFSEYGMITLNSTNTIAYIPQYDPSPGVIACPIVNDLILGTCTNTGATGLTGYPSGIVLNSTDTVAYIAAYGNSPGVVVCDVSGTTFSNCVLKTGNGTGITFSEPGGVALNTSGNILYVADYGTGSVYGCAVTPNNTAFFSSCFTATTSTPDAWGIAIDKSGTFAYVANYNTNVYQCPILPNGTFGSCTTQVGFTEAVDVAFGY